ncbi:helix-turn-helix domain-containing protein [Enterococcus raffinosus]|uniref:helix-turn-helix domain-containing protein n=1 Tax=Enterococcus raffinosus TaxID=71452 RepID=UPI003DA54E8A
MLCDEKKISIAELERKLDFANSSIRKWDERTPGVDKIQKVADFFDVSTDYLLGRTDKRNYYDLTEKDQKDIQKQLEKIVEDMSKADSIAFSKDSEELSPEAKAAVLASLEESLRIGKTLAKKKFTPNKYRNGQ